MGYSVAERKKRLRAAIEKGAESMAISIHAIEQGKEDPSCWEENGVMKTLPCLPMINHTVHSVGTTAQERLNDVAKYLRNPVTTITTEEGEHFVLNKSDCKRLESLWKARLEVLRNQAAVSA